MFAGKLDRRITVERNNSDNENAFGEDIEKWEPFLSRISASRKDASDSERFSAGKTVGALLVRFMIRSSSDAKTITTADRISHDGKTFEIHGIKEVSSGCRHGFLEITASTKIS